MRFPFDFTRDFAFTHGIQADINQSGSPTNVLTIVIISDILIFRMNQQIQATAIVRQRGQLTIPDFIREITDWIRPGSVVSISKADKGEIVIKPNSVTLDEKEKSWKETWEKIQLARSFKGKGGNLSQFIAEDRQRH